MQNVMCAVLVEIKFKSVVSQIVGFFKRRLIFQTTSNLLNDNFL